MTIMPRGFGRDEVPPSHSARQRHIYSEIQSTGCRSIYLPIQRVCSRRQGYELTDSPCISEWRVAPAIDNHRIFNKCGCVGSQPQEHALWPAAHLAKHLLFRWRRQARMHSMKAYWSGERQLVDQQSQLELTGVGYSLHDHSFPLSPTPSIQSLPLSPASKPCCLNRQQFPT